MLNYVHPSTRLALSALLLTLATSAPAAAGSLSFYEDSESPGNTQIILSPGTGLLADIDYDASTGEGGGLKGRISELEILAVGAVSFTSFLCESTSTTSGESCLVAISNATTIFLTAGDSSGQGPNGGNPNELPTPPSIYDLGQISFDATGVGSIELTGCNYTSAEGATGQLRTCDAFTLVQVVPEPGTAALLALGVTGLALRRRRVRPFLAALIALASFGVGDVASAQVPSATVTGPIADGPGPNDHAMWDSWFDLTPFGYEDEEYFISGTARRFPAGASAAYTTRIIVTRPTDPANFNGTVLMDWVNVTAQFENAVDTISAHDFLIREGYAFVHVSAQSTGLCCAPLTPKTWNPVRYAAIDHPDPPNTFQNNYDIDIFAQIARALKDPAPGGADPMNGLNVDRIIAAGQSQSAGRLDTYARQYQGGTLGEFWVDAFIVHGGGSKTGLPADSPSPVLHLLSDAEASTTDPGVSPNYVLWEVAGSAHADFWIGVHQEEGANTRVNGGVILPSTADEDLHQGNPPYTAAENYGEQVDPGQPVCIAQGTQFPMHYSVNAAIHHVDQWLRTGVKPPDPDRYEFDGGSLARDIHGNAVGGIRLAPVEHPIAEYRSTDCGLGGTTVPFTDPEIHALYPTHADYACLVKNTTYQTVKDGWMLREDAVDMVSRADAATNRWLTAAGGVGVQDCDGDSVADDMDNCPFVANPGQEDSGTIGAAVPDGIGDACQCGDVSGDGIVDGIDRAAMERRGLGITPNPDYNFGEHCDVDGNGVCNGQDASATNRALNSLPTLFGQHCESGDPYAKPCTNCFDAPESVTYFIEDGPNEQAETLAALFSAVSGDTVEFGVGAFEFNTTLILAHKENITIRGQGRDQTILDFLGSLSPEGLSFSHMAGITIEDLTVIDTPGFAIKVSDSDFVTMRGVRAMWSSADSDPTDEVDDRGGMDPKIPSTLNVTCVHEASFPESTATYVDALGATRNYVTDSGNGGYAIYPVLSNDILLDDVISIGSSDAGIYVGQSNDVIIKNSEAVMNVAGFEIENTDDADVFDNVAHCNTGGFLTFDLPGLNQYGDRTRTFNNYSGYNNTPNFAPGGIVAAVPGGIGVLQLGYDKHEVFDNIIEWNRTVGFVYVGHYILGGSSDLRMDYSPEGVYVYRNTFTTNGTSPSPPNEGVIVCAEGTGPGFDDPVPCVPVDFDDGDESLLPALIQIKGAAAGDGYGPTGGHIVWDGVIDFEPLLAGTNGQGPGLCDVTSEFPASTFDSDGKPQYTGQDHPSCRYNLNKFSDPLDPSTRIHPLWWSCLEDDDQPASVRNTFSVDSRKYMNFDGIDPTVAPKVDIKAHDCPTEFGEQLALLPAAVVEEYVPGAGCGDPPPNAAAIAAICADYSGTTINRDALQYNCAKLSEYNLFADPTDPRSGPNEGGILFDLTTPLFSDYAHKSRFLFLPPGESATWNEGNADEPNATLDLPLGTVIAKTFWFEDDVNEDVVETRLLIHREGICGGTVWEGMAFLWEYDEFGNPIDADLAVGGAIASVSWDYDDPDPDVTATYVGDTDEYLVPHANQCGNCHINDDKQPGDAPIGLKVRLLNRKMDYGSGDVNQLQHWVTAGLLSGAPALGVDGSHIAANVQRAPRYNVPGDAASIPTHPDETDRIALLSASELDLELRARAWLESNCAHCHNRDGLAQSTGVFLDTFRRVDINYGVCKTPTTAGSSSGGHDHDLVPLRSDLSIMSFRVHSVDASAQMPPVARSVVHDEGAAVFDAWVDTVVDGRYDGASICIE